MIEIKVVFNDGDFLFTKFNGTLEKAKDYYLGHYFNFGKLTDDMKKCISVELLD